MKQHLEYLYDFYAYQGIYPLGVKRAVIRKAYELYAALNDVTQDFDSVDRERVRDLIEGAEYNDTA